MCYVHAVSCPRSARLNSRYTCRSVSVLAAILPRNAQAVHWTASGVSVSRRHRRQRIRLLNVLKDMLAHGVVALIPTSWRPISISDGVKLSYNHHFAAFNSTLQSAQCFSYPRDSVAYFLKPQLQSRLTDETPVAYFQSDATFLGLSFSRFFHVTTFA